MEQKVNKGFILPSWPGIKNNQRQGYGNQQCAKKQQCFQKRNS